MKISALILFISSYLFASNEEFKVIEQTNCQCVYPLKTNTNWCNGPKGGKYCLNKKGNKYYKPKAK